jgi:hypothetical protein
LEKSFFFKLKIKISEVKILTYVNIRLINPYLGMKLSLPSRSQSYDRELQRRENLQRHEWHCAFWK